MKFEKWQALGNDYLIFEADDLPWELTAERVKRICDPHFGVGSDGILLLSKPADDAHVADLRIFNPDGSEAELSGNGAREACSICGAPAGPTPTGSRSAPRPGRSRPRSPPSATARWRWGRRARPPRTTRAAPRTARGELEAGGRSWSFQHVSIGNPQCAIEVG